MERENPKKSKVSRRRVLKSAAWAAPVCIAGGVIPLLQGCGKTEVRRTGDVLELGARAAVERIRKGEMKAEAYLTRLIQHHTAHKDLNVVITMDEARVLEAARAVDSARAKGDTLGPLAGLPLAIKDNINVAGYPTTLGNPALKGFIPTQNATVIETVLKNGAIVFAKTNVPTRVGGDIPLSSPSGANRHYGTPRNPYDPTRHTGGSSAGNGAAVAARIVPAALGEDSTGSVRIPAGLCGIAGLRPTTRGERKRYSDEGFLPPPTGFNKTMGPMARTVADVAFLDAVITGVAAPAVNMREVRIGVPRADYWSRESMDPGVAQVTQAALAKLRDAGAQLIETDLEELIAYAANLQLGGGGNGAIFAEWLAQNLPNVTLEQVYDGYPLPVADAAGQPQRSAAERAEIQQAAYRRHEEFFRSNNIKAVAFPTVPYRAPVIEPQGKLVDVKGAPLSTASYPTVRWGSMVGAPGLSIPSGLTSGLPVGLELDALPGDDSWLLGLGIEVEKVLGPLPPPALLKAA